MFAKDTKNITSKDTKKKNLSKKIQQNKLKIRTTGAMEFPPT